MPMSDDELVEQGYELVRTIRPRICDEHRQEQLQTLQRLVSTRTNIQVTDQSIKEFNIKRGRLLELLVRSQPDYPQMEPIERQAVNYLLAAMVGGSVQFTRSKRSLKNPDDIEAHLEGSTLHISSIIEIKHNIQQHKKTLMDQLDNFSESLRIVVEALEKKLRAGSELPTSETDTWPSGVEHVVIDQEIRQIIFLPSDRFKSLPGWEIRHSVFSKREINTLVTHRFWDKLVGQGGAVVAVEGSKMAIRRASEPGKVRPRDGVDVHEHEGQGVGKVNSTVHEVCGVCNNEPFDYVRRPIDDRMVYFQWNVDGRQVRLGRNCIKNKVSNDLKNKMGSVDMAFAEVNELLPPDVSTSSIRASATKSFKDLIANQMRRPSERLYVMQESGVIADKARLSLMGAMSLEAKRIGDSSKSPSAKQALGNLEQLDQFRLNFLRGLGERLDDAQLYEPEDEDEESSPLGQRPRNVRQLFQWYINTMKQLKAALLAEEASQDLDDDPEMLEEFEQILGERIVLENSLEDKTPEETRRALREIGANGDAKVGGTQASETQASDQLVCPSCGEDNRAGRRLCNGCGEPLKQEKPPEVPKPQEPRVCPSCRTEAQPGDKICDNCGAQLPPEAEQQSEEVPSPAAIAAVEALDSPQPAASPEPAVDVSEKPKFCTECGEQNPSDAKYCKGCGHALPQ